MNKRILAIIISCIFLIIPLVYADIYKCVDKNGTVRFSDKPCFEGETSAVFIHEENKQENKDTVSDAPASSHSVLDKEEFTDNSHPNAESVNEKTQETPIKETRKKSKTQTKPQTVSIQDFINKLETISPLVLLTVFIAPPFLALIIGFMHRKGSGNYAPWKYLYSLLVYMVCIPGILACVMTAYSVFFIRQNLLNVNVFAYFLPIISMIVTLIMIGRHASWKKLPGVDRLYALIIVLFISFSAVLAIQKTRIWIVFGGSVWTLIIIALICFVVLKWSLYKLLK